MVFGVKSFGTLVVFSDTENGGGEVDEKTLDHIAVTKKPVKTEYRTGEEFEPEGWWLPLITPMGRRRF